MTTCARPMALKPWMVRRAMPSSMRALASFGLPQQWAGPPAGAASMPTASSRRVVARMTSPCRVMLQPYQKTPGARSPGAPQPIGPRAPPSVSPSGRAKAFTLGEYWVSSFTGIFGGSPSAPLARHVASRSMKAGSIRSGQAGVQAPLRVQAAIQARASGVPGPRAAHRPSRPPPRPARRPRRRRHRGSSGRPARRRRRRCTAPRAGRIRRGYARQRHGAPGSTAMPSISMQTSVVVNWAPPTQVLAGGVASASKAARRTSLKPS